MTFYKLIRRIGTAAAPAALVAGLSGPAHGAAPVSDPNVPKVAQGGNAFGLALMRTLTQSGNGKNVFVSPFSVSQALSLALNGAGGATRDEIAATLQLRGTPLDAINQGNAALLTSLSNPDPKVSLSIANALWANRDTTLKPDFQDRCHRYYRAQTSTLDFSNPSAAGTINAWVSKNTQGKITELVTASLIRHSPAVLTNAVYFHGQWTNAFDKTDTRDAPFTLQGGGTKSVPMMVRTSSYSYLDAPGFQAIRLPYGTGRIAMYVFLPKDKSGLNAFVHSATPANWNGWLSRMRPSAVSLFLPRFKASQDLLLNQPLARLGMGAAFGAGADFKPMGLERGFIGDVIHKAILEVDEQGTVAAAATGMVMRSAAVSVPRPPAVMRVDHPFFLAIRDDSTGALLFTGAIRNPE
jgi:serpin B